ncbi:MAG: hypothetical protein CMD74_02355 [Gammaproteobacteria bacterium]|nr:hypothetical protein [Gammaproteobacteria bacterium]|tara:strand:+ start:63 stop:305 length:243 start_codon:yes stop_codon:yes gene_type:complete
MAKVIFPDHLLPFVGGNREINIEAKRYRELVEILETRWPGCGIELEKCAVAIDSQIYQDAFLEDLLSESEVFFVRKIEGG